MNNKYGSLYVKLLNALDSIIQRNKLGFSFVNVTTYHHTSQLAKPQSCNGNRPLYAGSNSIRCFKTGVQNTSSKNGTGQNYFELLGCDVSFDIDEKDLERKFRARLSQWHPDLHSQSSSQLQEQAASLSAAVNQAYSVLKKPHLRAKYLLELKGTPLSEDDMTVDPSFLMHVMELRETVEEESDKTRLEHIRESVVKETQVCLQNLSEAFQKDNMEVAVRETQKLQYYERLREALVERLD